MQLESKISVSIFLLGFLGVIAMFLSPFPIPIPEEVLEQASEKTIKIAAFVQSTILLGLMVLLGHFTSKKVGLSAPLIHKILKKDSNFKNQIKFLKQGAIIGLILGLLMAFVSSIWLKFLPIEFIELGESMSVSPALRFLYGGLTEEVLIRWGLMSFFVWFIWRIFQYKKLDRPTSIVFWVGIFLAAFLFGMGHLPIALNTVKEMTISLYAYIIGLNMVFGVVAGWLFWKKGIETAMLSHIFAHVGMLFFETFMQ